MEKGKALLAYVTGEIVDNDIQTLCIVAGLIAVATVVSFFASDRKN